MKYIILILFIFSGISLSACELETETRNAGHELAISKETSSDDCCSEFCACVCCTKIPATKNVSELTDLFTNYTNFQASHNHILSNKFYDHWQPPKVK